MRRTDCCLVLYLSSFALLLLCIPRRDSFNLFDGFIVVTSFVELGLTPPSFIGDSDGGGGGALSALRTFRILRVFKLLRWVGWRVGFIPVGISDSAAFRTSVFFFNLTYVCPHTVTLMFRTVSHGKEFEGH